VRIKIAGVNLGYLKYGDCRLLIVYELDVDIECRPKSDRDRIFNCSHNLLFPRNEFA